MKQAYPECLPEQDESWPEFREPRVAEPEPAPLYNEGDIPKSELGFFKGWLKRTIEFRSRDGSIGRDPHAYLAERVAKAGGKIALSTFLETLKRVHEDPRFYSTRRNLNYETAQTARLYYLGLCQHRLGVVGLTNKCPEVLSIKAILACLENALLVLAGQEH